MSRPYWWVVTIPKTTPWDEYRRELAAVEADPHMTLNFRVPHFPREMKVGDRCYVVWNGRIRGWMEIVGLDEFDRGWTCEVTGREWPPGKYIQRKGKFHHLNHQPEMTGFRGVQQLVKWPDEEAT